MCHIVCSVYRSTDKLGILYRMRTSTSTIGRLSALLVMVLLGMSARAEGQSLSPAQLRVLFPCVGESVREELGAEGHYSRLVSRNGDFLLTPGTEYQAKITADLQAIDYSVGVEVVRIIPGAFSDLSPVDLANMLLELSTLAGLEYYSGSKGKMRTLFEQSYVVDNEADRNRIDDPSVDAVPADGNATVFQEDSVFGKNVSAIDYEVTGSTIHMVTTNLTTFSIGFVPIIRPERLRLHVLIYRADDYLIYYGNFAARALRVSSIEDRIHNSFYNRLVALYGWFEAKLGSYLITSARLRMSGRPDVARVDTLSEDVV